MRRLFVFLIFLILIGLAAVLGCGEPEDFDSLAKEGLAAYHKADYNEAIYLFGKALHLKPSDRDMCLIRLWFICIGPTFYIRPIMPLIKNYFDYVRSPRITKALFRPLG